jgi:hypothetical protein
MWKSVKEGSAIPRFGDSKVINSLEALLIGVQGAGERE